MAMQIGKATLLDDVIDYVKYLQYQVKVNTFADTEFLLFVPFLWLLTAVAEFTLQVY